MLEGAREVRVEESDVDVAGRYSRLYIMAGGSGWFPVGWSRATGRLLYDGSAARDVCQYMYIYTLFLYMRCGAGKGKVVLVEDNFSAGDCRISSFHFPPGAGGSWRFMHHAAQGK